MNEVILFEHANFHGSHKHIFSEEPNLNAGDDKFFNDKVSSIAVLEGNWAFYRDSNFQNRYSNILGKGLYPWVENVDIKNDDMSSLKPVTGSATISGEQIAGHTMVFEHANFHGSHKHIFKEEPNLNAGDDNYFNDKVSSIAVLEGNWAFYRDSNFQNRYSNILGKGLYPWVENVDIKNDDMSSLKPG